MEEEPQMQGPTGRQPRGDKEKTSVENTPAVTKAGGQKRRKRPSHGAGGGEAAATNSRFKKISWPSQAGSGEAAVMLQIADADVIAS
jgi:hypothetical protein